MNHNLTRTQKVAFAAMILGVYVIATRLVGLIQPAPVFSFNRIGIGIPLIAFASIFLGPLYGVIVGVAGDALGWVFLGTWTGAFNVFLSVYYAIIGVVPWLLHRFLGKLLNGKHSAKAALVAVGVLFVAFMVVLWASDAFASGFARWNVDPILGKAVVSGVSAVSFGLTIAGLIVLEKRNARDDNLGEVVWMAIIIEAITIVLKPLAFYLYCWVFIGQDISVAWNISYGTLVLISILFSFVDVFITAAFLRLFLWIGRSRVKSGGSHESD